MHTLWLCLLEFFFHGPPCKRKDTGTGGPADMHGLGRSLAGWRPMVAGAQFPWFGLDVEEIGYRWVSASPSQTPAEPLKIRPEPTGIPAGCDILVRRFLGPNEWGASYSVLRAHTDPKWHCHTDPGWHLFLLEVTTQTPVPPWGRTHCASVQAQVRSRGCNT